jgi:hypothetical protein
MPQNINVGNLFLEAAKDKLRADIKDAKAIIELYVCNPVGVGEHSEITAEIVKAAERGAHAEEVLNFLENCK